MHFLNNPTGPNGQITINEPSGSKSPIGPNGQNTSNYPNGSNSLTSPNRQTGFNATTYLSQIGQPVQIDKLTEMR